MATYGGDWLNLKQFNKWSDDEGDPSDDSEMETEDPQLGQVSVTKRTFWARNEESSNIRAVRYEQRGQKRLGEVKKKKYFLKKYKRKKKGFVGKMTYPFMKCFNSIRRLNFYFQLFFASIFFLFCMQIYTGDDFIGTRFMENVGSLLGRDLSDVDCDTMGISACPKHESCEWNEAEQTCQKKGAAGGVRDQQKEVVVDEVDLNDDDEHDSKKNWKEETKVKDLVEGECNNNDGCTEEGSTCNTETFKCEKPESKLANAEEGEKITVDENGGEGDKNEEKDVNLDEEDTTGKNTDLVDEKENEEEGDKNEEDKANEENTADLPKEQASGPDLEGVNGEKCDDQTPCKDKERTCTTEGYCVSSSYPHLRSFYSEKKKKHPLMTQEMKEKMKKKMKIKKKKKKMKIKKKKKKLKIKKKKKKLKKNPKKEQKKKLKTKLKKKA